VRAAAAVTAELVGQRVALTRLRSEPPIAIRQTGPAQVHLVGTAAGPMAGDEVRLDLVVRAGAELTVCSSAATVALRGAAGVETPSRLVVRAVVEDGAMLRLWPEPTVAAAGCDHESRIWIDMAADSHMMVREELVGGRSCDRASGRLRCELHVDRAGTPVLHQTLTFGPDAMYGGAHPVPRCVGTLLVVGPAAGSWGAGSWGAGSWDADVMELPAPDTVVCALAAPGGWLTTALSEDAAQLRSHLETARRQLNGRYPLHQPSGTVTSDATGVSPG
jgi:urease accessory protein